MKHSVTDEYNPLEISRVGSQESQGHGDSKLPILGALAQTIFDRNAAGLIGLDGQGRVVLCNQAAVALLGVPRIPLAPLALMGLLGTALNVDADDRDQLAAALLGDAPMLCQRGTALTDGRLLRIAADPAVAGYTLITLSVATSDIPEERKDGLTGLSDRKWFHQRVGALMEAQGTGDRVYVMMIDLDRFKSVNDVHGHPVGDAVLQMVAQRLRSAVRVGDVVSRLGGDEFAVAMPAPASAEVTAKRLVDLLSRPYLVEGHLANIGASIGIASGPQDGTDAAALVRAADLALYQAKESGRKGVRVFDHEMDVRARARHALLEDLRRALVLQQFELHYQPQTNLASGKLTGFEALVRWRHPDHGLVPPDRFIPLAEEMGLIIPLGEWVLRTACLDAARWPDDLTVAVNVSAKQLASPERLPRAVMAALAESGLSAKRLEVEITESALVTYESTALQILHNLRDMGVRISMDDFGTGYSSLSQLRSFPFHKLKIDRSFIRDLSGSDEAVAVIRAIAALGASLGMTTTAEGVETTEQESTVQAEGCTDMQGYLVSRPVPAGDVAGLIARLTRPSNLSSEIKP
jgi:diguanylate cyclase (GGDEF)-like protein